MKRFIFPLLAMFAVAGVAVAAEVKSGLAAGDEPSPFHVQDITGPKKGTKLCYRCLYGAKPTAVIFTREVTPEVAKLVKQIDDSVGANKEKKLSAFVVLLTADVDAGSKQLTKLAEDQKIANTPLTIFEGVAGPEEYKIAKDAAVTVTMWNKSRVESNHAFASAKLTEEQVKAAADASAILK